jgi:glyoxylase-like metal-dependent hydrolase (beta-lactamase superfamily II)
MARWSVSAATGRQRTRFSETPLYREGLYDLGNRVYAWMVPNGSWGESNAGLVVGEGGSLLVDTLWDLNFTREMLQAMRPVIQDAPIRHLVNTHADGDHIWGNELLQDAEIIMTKACDQEAREMKPAAMAMLGKTGKTLERLGIGKAKKVGKYFHNMVAPYDFKGIEVKVATRTFEGEMALEVEGREVRLIEVGPAHTRGDLIVYVPDAKTLFCGDILFAGCTPVLWAGPVENYISALDRILGMDVDVVVPGHGPVSDKGAVTQEKEYLEYLQHEVGRRFEAGMPAKDAAYDIALGDDFSQQAFSSMDSPERIMTNTHVIYRHLQGRTGHLKAPEKLNILRKQALLAHELRDAAPASIRKP